MLTTKHIYIVYKKDYARLAFFILIVLFHLAFYGAIAQQISETGLPYVQNYSAEDYGAFDQNWDAAQDTLGVMYFANGDGVLSYDGTSWELLELPNKGTVFALAASNKGEIYVGAVDELGYLKPNSKGQLLYISLLAELPQKFHDFSEIRALCSTKEGIFFSSKKYIFKWDGIKFETWENSGDTFLFTVHDTLLKRIEGKGLMRLKNNQFELVSQGELFSSQRIYSILPFNKKELLVATRDHLFIYDGKTFTKFDTNAPHFFTDNTLYNGVALNNGSFAFGSLHKGLLIIDTQGQSEVVLSQNGLLRSNEVLGLFQDQSGILWASLNSGIAKMEYPSPFSFFNKHNGAPDMIFDFQRYHGQLFIGGPEGLFYLKNEKNAANNRFERVAGDFGMVWDMILFQDKMLVGAISGVFEIDTLGKSKKLSDLKVSSLYQSGINANRVFIGTGSGLAAMYFKDGQWALEHSFKGINSHVDKIVESDEGHLWLDIDKNEVVSVSFDNLMDAQNLKKPVIRIFTPADGLPDAVGEPYMIENQFYLVADREAYRFDPTSKKFINDKSLFVRLGLAQRNVKINHVDEKDQIWLIEYDGEKRMNQLLAIPQKDGTYILNSLEEQRIMDLRKYGLLAELHDSVIWYQGKPGVVRHDVRKKTYKHTIKARAIISRVLWKNDSLLFGGYALSTTPQLPFKNNQLRFQYASPGFYDETKNQFQYYLEGFDDQWSPWTSEIKKDYTNLPEGDYSFKVRSRDVFNHLSIEDRYSFTILPPWYRTWWAYLTYGLGAIALALLISQWRSRELRKKNETLEGAVKERTLEIRHKNKLLSAQTEKLMKLSDAKTQLYSNITHEFRTPLTVILGMTEALKSNVENNSFEGADISLEMIGRNGHNLLQLVNEMLDLAKAESGNMELQFVQTDVVPLVKYLSESFHSIAKENQINLTVYSEIDELMMDMDIAKLTSIISNVLSNAIKFTPVLGKIIVHINQVVQKDAAYFFIKVKDTGMGISREDIPNIFNRFYQSDASSSRTTEGTGIGLALTKELVALMKGTIDVKSTPGKGSEFIIHIPVSRNAPTSKDIQIINKPYFSASKPLPNDQLPEQNSELPLVLIIEDNTDVAHYLKTSLKQKYETLHAVNGVAGIETAFEKMPDIIICDVMMPGKDGFEVCETLKNDARTDHIPIIMLTAKVTSQDKIRGLSQGADAYLTKPFEKAELFTRIDQLILLRKKMMHKLEKNSFSSLLKEKAADPQTKFIQQLVQAIHKKLDDSDFGSLHLAREVHLSESQLYRKIKTITGKSTAIFIRSIRLQHAKDLLQSTEKNVSEVTYETGFNHPSWFSKAFKEEFGYPPSEINH